MHLIKEFRVLADGVKKRLIGLVLCHLYERVDHLSLETKVRDATEDYSPD